MALDETVVSSVANTNFKALGDVPASTANLSLQNAVANQQAMNQLQVGLIGAFNNILMATTGMVVRALMPADVAEALADAVVGQQGAKVAQSTPPETATGK